MTEFHFQLLSGSETGPHEFVKVSDDGEVEGTEIAQPIDGQRRLDQNGGGVMAQFTGGEVQHVFVSLPSDLINLPPVVRLHDENLGQVLLVFVQLRKSNGDRQVVCV